MNNSCFFTGHRVIPADKRNEIKKAVMLHCINLIDNCGVTDFIAGGALGFDTLAALTVLKMKEKYPNIRLHLYLPFTDQASSWSMYNRTLWEYIREHADDYRYITNNTYVAGCMQKRNRAMVDNAKFCIAYCTNFKSGTGYTISYAKKCGRIVKLI